MVRSLAQSTSRLSLAAAFLLASAAVALAQVRLGIDVLRDSGFAEVKGKRIGLVTNQTGTDAAGERDRVLLHRAPGVQLVALFTPEHGLDGTELAGKYVASRKDNLTGLQAYSLYGTTRKPTPAMLKGLDALVFDLQDIGSRSYTYLSTMGKCMQACAENHIEFIVLDRPDPLGGERVEGPGVGPGGINFVAQFPVPYVYGMTAGELAKMINAKHWMGAPCKLTVVPMKGWHRGMLWADTGLPWVRSSPNIPRGDSPLYYVATGLVGDITGPELGIGTDVPFQRMSASYLDSEEFTGYLRGAGLAGMSFSPYRGGGNEGANVRIDGHAAGNLTALNVYMIAAMYKASGGKLFSKLPGQVNADLRATYGGASLQRMTEAGMAPAKIVEGWTAEVESFRRERQPFLLY